MSEESTLYFVVEEPAETVEGERGSEDVGGGFGQVKQQVGNLIRKRVPISVESLNKQMDGLMTAVNQMFTQAQKPLQSGLELDEVELAVEVNGEGNLSILGTGGKAGGKGGITLKFKRVQPNL